MVSFEFGTLPRKEREIRLTFEYGTREVEIISGRTNKLTIQPHANNFILKSCQRATNVKTTKVARTGLFDPPIGTYKYLLTRASVRQLLSFQTRLKGKVE